MDHDDPPTTPDHDAEASGTADRTANPAPTSPSPTSGDPAALVRAWTEERLGVPSDRLAYARLPGATTSSIHAITVGASGPPSYVLRVVDHANLVAKEPGLAAHEARALEAAARAGLPAPRPVAWRDPDAAIATPLVLMSFVPGRIDLEPHRLDGKNRRLARLLAALHDTPAPEGLPVARSWRSPDTTTVPAWTERPEAWARAFDRLAQPPPEAPAVFLHRDVHPTNVLWTRGRISGLVDWLYASRGPAGMDLAHARVNLALLYGADVAADLLERYRSARPAYVHDPYWDLDAVVDSGWPRPRYYAPWALFGGPELDQGELQRRLDAHLARVLSERRGSLDRRPVERRPG